MFQRPSALVGHLVVCVIARGSQLEQNRIMVTPGIQEGVRTSQVGARARRFQQRCEQYKEGGLVFSPAAVSAT
jgi:hypothetical protein